MKKEEFYSRLFKGLNHFTKEEKEELKEYYEELICDGVEAGVSEEEVIDHLESPETISTRMNREHLASGRTTKNVNNERDTYHSQEPIAILRIKGKDRRISFARSRDEQVHVHCETGEFDEIICNESNGTFYFRQDTKRGLSFARFFTFSGKTEPIEVLVPDGVKVIEAASSNSGVQMKGVSAAERIELETNNAAVSVSECLTQDMTITTTNGGIKLDHLQTNTLNARTSNGTLKVMDIVGTRSIKLSTSNGAVQFDNLESDDVEVITSNGRITGTMNGEAGDYGIISRTTNGSSNLPTEFNLTQDKKLKVVTSNGKIHVDFTK